MLELRARMLATARAFFERRSVLEVDTPIVVNAPVTDVHIHSAQVRYPDSDAPFYLHTSPEYAMKRLLAAGSGDIYQICHVARGLERGRHHNGEFTLIEWYRKGFSLDALMDEVESLVLELLGVPRPIELISYRQAFIRQLAFDPFEAPMVDLDAAARIAGYTGPAGKATRDELLDLLMATRIGPRLGAGSLTFVHRYPASQAALAQLDPGDPRCALRFEVYCDGVELANGFKELASATEQRARFEADQKERAARGLPVHALDERLLAALESGLPDCAGVALGFDRLVMIAAGAQHIDDVLTFPSERA